MYPAGVKFQISLPTPIAPTYNNMAPTDRPALIPMLRRSCSARSRRSRRLCLTTASRCNGTCARRSSPGRAITSRGPVDFRQETIAELISIGDGVPASIEVGYHLCYGSPADEHVIQPKDAGIMVEMTNAVSAGVRRPIQIFHLPVPKPRADDAFFARSPA